MQGIAPNEVNAETFDKYLDYLVQHSTVANPRERWHVARRAWNRYIADVDANFPHIPNNEPDGWRGLPLSEFPESLRVGFENWRAHMLNSDPFANTKLKDSFKLGGPRKALKEVTAHGYIASLRQSASRLIEAGDAPVTQFASLQAFVDLDTVKAGLRRLLGNRNFDDARPAMHALMTATLNLAAYLKVKEDHLDELKWFAKKVRHRPTGMCERNKTRLQPFKDKEVLRRLIRLPLDVAKRLQDVKVADDRGGEADADGGLAGAAAPRPDARQERRVARPRQALSAPGRRQTRQMARQHREGRGQERQGDRRRT